MKAMKSGFKNNLLYFVPSIAYAFFFLLPTLGMNDVCDGASNEIIFSLGSLKTILFNNRWHDQSPLYFIILHYWFSFFPTNPFSYRILSLITILITGRVFFAIGMHITKKTFSSLGISFLFLVSPLATWSVYYGRMYPLITILTATSILYLLRFLERRKLPDLIFFTLSNVLLIYTHFFGFFLTFLFFAYWISFEILDYYSDNPKPGSLAGLFRKLAEYFYALAIIQILILPQTMRLGVLLNSPPRDSNSRSMSFNPEDFLFSITRFLLTKFSYPAELAKISDSLNMIVFIISGLLLLEGLRHMKKHVISMFFLFLVFSVFFLYQFGAGLDFRDRYFIYLAPFIFVAIGSGIFHIPEIPYNPLAAIISKTFRCVSAFFLVSVFLILSLKGTGIRRHEYSKMTSLVDRIITDRQNSYISSKNARGMPRLAAKYQNLDDQLQEVKANHVSTRSIFHDQLKRHEDFIFYTHGRRKNKETVYREKKLTKKGYHRIKFDLHRVSADLFFAHPLLKIDKLIQKSRLDGEYNSSSIVQWVQKNISHDMFKHSHIDSLFTSRISKEGSIDTPVFVATQNGFYPEWNYTEKYWKNVKLTDMVSRGISRKVILAHPMEGSTLVVAFPNMKMNNWLQIIHTNGANSRHVNEIYVEVYFDDSMVSQFTTPNKAGWLSETIDSSHWSGSRVNVTLLVRCKLETFAHFGFNYSHHASKPDPIRNSSFITDKFN